jgi:integrase
MPPRNRPPSPPAAPYPAPQTTLAPLSAGAPLALTTADRARVVEQLHSARSASTIRAYRADWRVFEAWCRSRGAVPLPASEETIFWFLSADGASSSIATVRRRLSALTYVHRMQGQPFEARRSWKIRDLLTALGKRAGPTREKAAIDEALLRRMLATLPQEWTGLRDRALLLVGYFGGFRRSEFTKLRVEDIELRPDGGIVAHLGKTKTDQSGAEKQVVPLQAWPADPDMCPVTALRRWLTVAGIVAGPVFRSETLNVRRLRGGPIGDKTVNLLVKRCIAALQDKKLDPSDFGAHSLRAGFVTQALRNGAAIHEVMRVTRHKSPEVLLRYQRETDPMKASAATKIHVATPSSGGAVTLKYNPDDPKQVQAALEAIIKGTSKS